LNSGHTTTHRDIRVDVLHQYYMTLQYSCLNSGRDIRVDVLHQYYMTLQYSC